MTSKGYSSGRVSRNYHHKVWYALKTGKAMSVPIQTTLEETIRESGVMELLP